MDEREPAGGPRRGGEGCGSRKLLVLKASESTACGVRGQAERGTAPAPGRAPAHPSSRGLCPGISLRAPSWARAGDLLPLSAFGGPRLLLSPLEPAGMVAGRGWGRPLTAAAGLTSRGRGLHCDVPCPLLMIIAPQTRSPLARFLHTCIASPRSRPPECPAPQCPAPSTTAVRGSSYVPGVQSLHVLRCWREMIFQ